jgi:hypothetical protein
MDVYLHDGRTRRLLVYLLQSRFPKHLLTEMNASRPPPLSRVLNIHHQSRVHVVQPAILKAWSERKGAEWKRSACQLTMNSEPQLCIYVQVTADSLKATLQRVI